MEPDLEQICYNKYTNYSIISTLIIFNKMITLIYFSRFSPLLRPFSKLIFTCIFTLDSLLL